MSCTKKRISSISLVTLLAVGLTGCAVSPTDSGKTVLRLALNQNEEHPSYIALDHFNDYLQEHGAGVTIDVFPNSALGGQVETIQLVGEGVIDMTTASGSQLENINDDFIGFGVPTVFDDIDHQMNVVQDPELTSELYSSMEESMGITVLGGLTQGNRSVHTSNIQVQKPEDLHGMKMRVQESKLNIAIAEALGASAAPMAFGEVYTALQSGVVDASENPVVVYYTSRHHEVAPYYSYTNHVVGLDFLLMNKNALDALSKSDRRIFEDGWEQTWKEHAELFKEQTDEAVKAAEQEGAHFSEVDSDAFEQPLIKVRDQFLVTARQKELYDQARELAR